MAVGRVPWYTLVVAATCYAALLGENAAELLPDPQVWFTESPSSEMNGLAYDAAAEVLYEVGFRYTDVETGDYLGSKYYFMRGIDVATGNTTFLMQNGSDQTDAFHGEQSKQAENNTRFAVRTYIRLVEQTRVCATRNLYV